jgi:hypothetical protein
VRRAIFAALGALAVAGALSISVVAHHRPGHGGGPQPTPTPTVAPSPTETASPAPPTPTVAPTPTPTATAELTATPDSTTPPPGPDPLTCAGYPEPRVFLESQAWWEPDPVYNGSSHVHLGTCFPYQATLTGVVHFDVRILLHSNSCTLRRVKLQNDDSRGDSYDVILSDHQLSFAGDGSNTQVLWVPMDANTDLWPDGLKSFQFYAFCDHPSGNLMRAQTDWTATTANGNSVVNDRTALRIDAQAWYTEASYAQPGLRSPYTFAQLVAPKSGTWTFTVRLGVNTDPGPVIGHMVTVDPDFHGGYSGVVIREASGTYSGSISIDTTQFANGPHRLILRVDKQGSGITADGINSGIQVVPFTVSN